MPFRLFLVAPEHLLSSSYSLSLPLRTSVFFSPCAKICPRSCLSCWLTRKVMDTVSLFGTSSRAKMPSHLLFLLVFLYLSCLSYVGLLGGVSVLTRSFRYCTLSEMQGPRVTHLLNRLSVAEREGFERGSERVQSGDCSFLSFFSYLLHTHCGEFSLCLRDEDEERQTEREGEKDREGTEKHLQRDRLITYLQTYIR